MKLSLIHISQDGVLSSNPYMEFPEKPTSYFFNGNDWATQMKLCEQYDKAVEQWHQGRLNFCEENVEKVHLAIHVALNPKGEEGIRPEPNTLIPVELECEVVEECELLCNEEWQAGDKMVNCLSSDAKFDKSQCKNVTRLLRLVDKKQINN